ncbi:MAG: tetratricopeptide repeat protein [Gemmatimonadaceae bacterium]
MTLQRYRISLAGGAAISALLISMGVPHWTLPIALGMIAIAAGMTPESAMTAVSRAGRGHITRGSARRRGLRRRWMRPVGLSPIFESNESGEAPVAAFDMGYSAFRQERWELAVAALERAVHETPADFDAWYYLGRSFAELGRHAEAVDAFTRVTAGRPRFADAHYRLALALAEIGRQFSARRAVAEAIRLDPRIARQSPAALAWAACDEYERRSAPPSAA